MTTNYARGRAVEYRVRDALTKAGYAVVRAAGSKGPWDLVALPHDRTQRPLVIQVKALSGEPKDVVNNIDAGPETTAERLLICYYLDHRVWWAALYAEGRWGGLYGGILPDLVSRLARRFPYQWGPR